jgi:hypothetical protein
MIADLEERTMSVSTYRQSVRDYIRACEDLLNSPDLSDYELERVEDMARRLSAFACEPSWARAEGDETAP